MGVGVSLAPLAGEVARMGGVGTLSTAALEDLLRLREGRRFSTFQAAEYEVRAAKTIALEGYVAVNVMCACATTYVDSVRGAVAGGVDAIISGAGLPVDLPFLLADAPDVALIPIVSSVRALRILVKQWKRRGATRLADAVVVEGPLAGGHLGFKAEELESDENRLENLVPPIIEYASTQLGGIPVIAAGGIWSREDIDRYLDMGCAAVQLGTRFLCTVESSASEDFKQAIIETQADEITLAEPASPCGYHPLAPRSAAQAGQSLPPPFPRGPGRSLQGKHRSRPLRLSVQQPPGRRQRAGGHRPLLDRFQRLAGRPDYDRAGGPPRARLRAHDVDGIAALAVTGLLRQPRDGHCRPRVMGKRRLSR
jgi:NAD(P)H-dependent flavin oxidoreductase YrpB (nitropropane dioxygenase family)